LLLIAVATLCFASTESRVSRATILRVEETINDKFHVNAADPYDLLGTARGTYLEGYGALFTVELQLVNVQPANPFRARMSEQEIESIRERKVKKIPVMKEAMRNLMVDAVTTLEGLPPNERVAMEAILWNFSWENSRGIPHRVFMSAEKQKLLDAKATHATQAELAAIIEEQER
jgi:hypothetical protein